MNSCEFCLNLHHSFPFNHFFIHLPLSSPLLTAFVVVVTVFNILSPFSADYVSMGVGPSTRACITSQNPCLWRIWVSLIQQLSITSISLEKIRIHVGTLSGLILCRSCVCGPRYCESMCAQCCQVYQMLLCSSFLLPLTLIYSISLQR